MAWHLSDAGYQVELDVWDWAAGRNFVTAFSDALDRCDRVVALFSAAYFDRSRYTTEEWSASVLHVLGGDEGRLVVPVRVEAVPDAMVPAVLRPLAYRDLFGLSEEAARRALLEAVQPPGLGRPGSRSSFPGRGIGVQANLGRSGPRVPGSVPQVWKVPARNQGSPGGTGCWWRCGSGCWPVTRRWCKRCTGWAGWTRTSSPRSTRTGSPGPTTWRGGWTPSRRRFSLASSRPWALSWAASSQAPRLMWCGRRCWPSCGSAAGTCSFFDNAERPGDVAGWLPGGGGHVLITSREQGWDEIAAPVEIDVLARPESVTLLLDRVVDLQDADAGVLAAELGDLPLALAQAAAFMAETGTLAADYLDLLRSRATDILGQSTPLSYPRSLASATRLAIDRLAEDHPAEAELASLCAFFAPEPIPGGVLTAAAAELPPALAEQAADRLAWRQTLARLARHGLARVDHRGVQLHRLT